VQRSLSVSSTTVRTTEEVSVTQGGGDELPPLLKHIMSSSSMVEEIERQQRSVGAVGSIGKNSWDTLT